MVKAQASTLIARTPAQVFELIAVDFYKNYQRWSPEVVSLTRISQGPLRLGSIARQVRVDQGRRTEATFRVCAYEPHRRLDFEGVSSPFHVSYRMDESVGGTRLTFSFELRRLELYMRPFEKLIRNAVQDGAERVVRNLKGLIEAETPPGT